MADEEEQPDGSESERSAAQRQRRARRVTGATVVAVTGTLAAVLALGRDVFDFTVDDLRKASSGTARALPSSAAPAQPAASAPATSPSPGAPAGKTPTRVTASIVTPPDGGVPLCIPVAGTVAGLTGDRAAWLLVKGPDTGDLYYLTGRVTTTARNPGHWTFDMIRIGDPQHVGKTFAMLVVGTDGEATDEYARTIQRPNRYVKLPEGHQVLDDVVVTVQDRGTC
jgi:hypothetical protein